jgi:hypothetical protein
MNLKVQNYSLTKIVTVTLTLIGIKARPVEGPVLRQTGYLSAGLVFMNLD